MSIFIDLAESQEIIADAPVDANYWDTVDKKYVKNLTANHAGQFEWQYLSVVGEWNYCSSEANPVTTGDFIQLTEIQRRIPLSTHDYLKHYYTAHQASQAKLISDQEHLKRVATQEETKSIRYCVFLVFLLVALAVISTIFQGFIA